MLSIYTLAVLAAALVSAKEDWKTSAPAFSSAVPTQTFALTIPAGSSSDDWYPTSASSYTSTVFTTTVYTVTSCAPTVVSCPVGAVTTETITSTTVICPLTSTTPLPPPPPPATTASSPTTAVAVSASSGTVAPTSSLATTYVAPVYSANTTLPYVKPSGTTGTKPSAFTGAANMVGGSLSLAAVVAFAVAAL